jgi:hypothetical protein
MVAVVELRLPAAAELLAVWERALVRPAPERPLALLAAACPGASVEDLATLSVGQRDGLLLTLREWLFGSTFTGLADCPTCGEVIELSFSAADVRVEPTADQPQPVETDRYKVVYRLPSGLDLAVALTEPNTDAARRSLLAACILTAQDGTTPVLPDALPEVVVAAVEAGMAEADPQADISASLTCPACGHGWSAPFDIASFLWQEIGAWAERTLWEVHHLARAYGWRETDILSLSPSRRHTYLSMVMA